MSDAATLTVTVLGSGSPIPDPDRAGPSTLVRAAGRSILVDSGRGALMRLAAAGGGANQLDALLVTHLHSDHLTDLNDVITTRWVTSFAPSPLPLHGPVGLGHHVDALLTSLEADIGYRLSHHEDLTWRPDPDVHEHVAPDDGPVIDIATVGDLRVTAAATSHRPVSPSLGYRIQAGGRSVVLAGDTIPCAGLDALAAGADVLVHTVIRDDLLRAIPLQRLQDVCDYHSSVEQAAGTAARAGVGTLVLTHCVPAVTPDTAGEWLERARAHFDGDVVLADDLTTVSA